jgi:hypothetical protein
MILILTLLAPFAGEAWAQEAVDETTTTAEATTTADKTTTAPAERESEAYSSGRTRTEFSQLLRQHPDELATILKLDPTLLSNEAFLAGYPELAKFVAAHPEVRRNPRFYLYEFQLPYEVRRSALEQMFETLLIFASFTLAAFVLAWLVRTIIEQKRWNRLSRSQSEVHNKILDRFGTTGELLEYVRSPAGTKFLESAPIPLHAEKNVQSPPQARILWSVQLGVVVVAGALGMILVSGRFDPESAQGFFGLGVIALSVGAGFIASAFISLTLSRRLGLWPGQDSGQDS